MTNAASDSIRARIHRFRDGDQSEPLALAESRFAAGLNTRIEAIDIAARRIRLSFHPGQEYVAGPRRTLQGGAIATMLDFSMVYLVIALTAADKASATANLNISYLKPAFSGAYLAEAEIERLGRTLGFARARLQTPAGDAVATASGTFPIFDLAPPQGPA